MKKYIATVAALALFSAGVASAAIVRNLTQSRTTKIEIRVDWNDSYTEVEWITLAGRSIVLDDNGKRVGDSAKSFQYDDLSAPVQASVRNLIQFIGRDLSNHAVGEDVSPNFKANMQRPER